MVDFSGLKNKLAGKEIEEAQVEEAHDQNNLEDLISQLSSVNKELAKNIKEIEVNSLQIMVERNKKQGYGESYAIMGVQGAAFQVIHKAARLLNTIYDTEEQGFKMTGKEMVQSSIDEKGNWRGNSVFDHLLDLLNYSRLTLNLFIRARNQGMLTNGKDENK